MLLSAPHAEEGEGKLHLLMVDNRIPACTMLYELNNEAPESLTVQGFLFAGGCIDEGRIIL